MSGTYTNLNYHLVFSTKYRMPQISDAFQERLYEYIGGILRNQKGVLDTIGGIANHLHLLVRWTPTGAVSDLLKDIKQESSKWLHQTFPDSKLLYWQDGYAAFTVSESQCEKVRRYIRNQARHHGKMDFKTELIALLKAHGVQYDERYIFD